MKRQLLALTCAAIVATNMVVARAAEPSFGTITPASPKVTWQGARFTNASTPSPEACVLPGACDEYSVHLGLGAAYWTTNPGALQVGIQWRDDSAPESVSEYDTFDLYVYDALGALVASSVTPVQSSMGIASSAQVVNMPSAADGDYRVLVVPSNVADRAYHGVAMVQSSKPPISSGPLLPDLHALQPTNFTLRVGTLSLSRVATDAASCYPDETAQDPSHPTRCLRFDAGHSNTGLGDFLLDIDLSKGEPVTAESGTPTIGGPVSQVVQQADGSTVSESAGRFEFHVNHGHIHYKSFARYDLYRVDGGARAEHVLSSRKSDFCMIDVDDLWFGLPGNGPRERHFPQCNAFDKIDASQITQRQGINRGWSDIYTWDLPGQYVDITGLADGTYDVVNTVNPTGLLDELDKSDASNVAFTRIQITGDTITCVPAPGAPCPV